jgi:3',5'-cyclic AMP phosphodiesterase CpdA
VIGSNGTEVAVRVAWTTDLHLNFVDDEHVARFIGDVRNLRPDALLIGGDIGEADTFAGYLQRLADELDAPIHFVLGNHDYYKGSIAAVQEEARRICRDSNGLNWLAESDPVWLNDRTALVGHGGWGDARAGDFLASDVVLNDYLLIAELRSAADVRRPENILNPVLMATLHRLGDETAEHLRRVLPEALGRREHVLVVMHVPPFREACWYRGTVSDDNWAPHFTCLAAGKVLLELAERHPQRQITVLCGHTHSPGHAQIRDNLEIRTGEAEYGEPKVQSVLELG